MARNSYCSVKGVSEMLVNSHGSCLEEQTSNIQISQSALIVK